jgi:hypothetical protein
MIPKVGHIVHYVGESHKETPAKKHFRAKLVSVSEPVKGSKKYFADLEVQIGENRIKVHMRPMALSRERGSWHPIGGFGCEEKA